MTIIGGLSIDANYAIQAHHESHNRKQKEQTIQNSIFRSMNRRQQIAYEYLHAYESNADVGQKMLYNYTQPRQTSLCACYNLWWLVVIVILASIAGISVQLFFADTAKEAFRFASASIAGARAPTARDNKDTRSYTDKTDKSNTDIAVKMSYHRLGHMEYSVVTASNICRVFMNYVVERDSHDKVLGGLVRSSIQVQSSVYAQEMSTMLRAYNRCYPPDEQHKSFLAQTLPCEFPILEMNRTCRENDCFQTRHLSCSRRQLLSLHTACYNATMSTAVQRPYWLLCMSCVIE